MSYNFGKTIKSLRQQRGLTQEQLAEAMGVSPQAVSRWETNSTYPDLSLLPILANFFDVSIDALLAFDVTKKSETIRTIIEEADALMAESRYTEAVCILREAYVGYPGNDRLMYKLAWALRGTKGESEDNYEEAIHLYLKLLEISTDTQLRAMVTRDLMYCYYTKGRVDLARKYADQLPGFEVCREYNLGRGNCLKGKELAEYLRSNLRLYGQAMIECLEYFTNPRILTDEQKAPLTAKQAEEAIAWIKKAMEQ
ncbi:MAG: helix-turn-helix transcriptional regulator [Clostridia bacterium]|nr:helix-turn-helix transcriptional regulator [Clostridia bacterium]